MSKKFFSDFLSRFWKSSNIPTKWCLNHSSSSMIRKFMTLWSLKIWEVKKNNCLPPLKKKHQKEGVKIKKSKFPIMRSINNGLKSYQKKFQPNRRKFFFFVEILHFFGQPAPQKIWNMSQSPWLLFYYFFSPYFHAKYSGYLLQ